MTNAEARFNNSLRPRKPEGSLGRTAQVGHLDSHTAQLLNYEGNVQTEPTFVFGRRSSMCARRLPAGVLGLPPLLVVNYYFICKCLLANYYFIRRCLLLCSCAKMPFWLTPFFTSSVKDQGRCLRSGVHKERELGFFPLRCWMARIGSVRPGKDSMK